jgi:hypothetical protein
MSSTTATQVRQRPYNWQPERARNLPDTWYYVEKHRNPSLPLSTAMLVVIFFEESTCCNTVQKPPYAIGPGQIQAADFGPRHFFAGLDHHGKRKDNFMGGRWDSSTTTWAVNWKTSKRYQPRPIASGLPVLTPQRIFNDFEFGVKMHVKLLEWEWKGHGTGKPKSRIGELLGAQLGGQSPSMRRRAAAAFLGGAQQLDALMRERPTLDFGADGSLPSRFYTERRRKFANVLNVARSQIKNNSVGFSAHPSFWEFFLPDGFLEDPVGYRRWGF